MRMLQTALLFVLAWGLAGQVPAQVPSPRPQWSLTFDSRERIDEVSQSPLRASWARLADGGRLLLSRDAQQRAVLRDYDAAGMLRATQRFPQPHTTVPNGLAQLAADSKGSGVYAVSSRDELDQGIYHFLHHYRPGSSMRLVTPLPYWTDEPPGPVVKLLVLDDDSIIVLRRHSISRIRADGYIPWSFGTAFSDEHFDAYDMAQAADGTLWVVGQGGPRDGGAPPSLASVWRFLPGGRRLPTHQFRCDSCPENTALGVALRSDGSAAVVGRSTGDLPGFIAFYDADGTPGLRVDTPASHSYSRVAVDGMQNIYALSTFNDRVSAIDHTDGQVRWSHEGSDFAARDAGVLVSHKPLSGSGTVSVKALDVQGELLWARQLEDSDGLKAGGAETDAAGGTTLIVEATPESGECGKGPRLVSLDQDGQETSRLFACNRPGAQRVVGIASDAAAGALVNLAHNTNAVSADAKRRWQYQTCAFCSVSGNWNIAAQHVLADGSAWLLVYEPRPPPIWQELYLLRLGADGGVLVRASAGPVLSGSGYDTAILPDADGVILLGPTPGGLDWARFSAAGALLGQQSLQWEAPHDTSRLLQWRHWPGGGISALVYHRDYLGCDFSPPICPPAEQNLLHMAADGSLLWRYDAGSRHLATYAGFEPDGTTVLLYGPEDSSALQLRAVAADGTPGPLSVVADSDGAYVDSEAGPVHGHYLVRRAQELLLLDRSGSVLRRLDSSTLGPVLARGDAGFLVRSTDSDAVLLSHEDLASLAAFDVDGQPGTAAYVFDTYWQLHDDGSIYTAAPRSSDGTARNYPRITRFALPGTPAADFIFIARFD
jgi:outer membrane protein assembly factor BamB